jgi:hypothetical protein
MVDFGFGISDFRFEIADLGFRMAVLRIFQHVSLRARQREAIPAAGGMASAIGEAIVLWPRCPQARGVTDIL